MKNEKGRMHEDRAPRDDTPYLGRPKKPRPKPELFRPVQLPGTEWKKGHARFDQTKRIWVTVKGHYAKIPQRRGFDDAAPELADRRRCSRLRANALKILWEAFFPSGTPVVESIAKDPDLASESSNRTRGADHER